MGRDLPSPIAVSGSRWAARACPLATSLVHQADRGLQLKSHRDVEEEGFAKRTLAQIQNSGQHGLERLILAAQITNNSNAQKARGMLSGISAMNDPCIVAIPPERA